MPKPRETRSKSSEKELRKAEEEEGEEGAREREGMEERKKGSFARERKNNRNPLVISCNVDCIVVSLKLSLTQRTTPRRQLKLLPFDKTNLRNLYHFFPFLSKFFPTELSLSFRSFNSPFRLIPFLIIRREIHEIFTRPLIVLSPLMEDFANRS